MSKLTETVCIKVSKETKDFLDGIENSSLFIRKLILRSQIAKSELKEITEFLVHDGEEMVSFDEERFDELVNEISTSVLKEMFQLALDK